MPGVWEFRVKPAAEFWEESAQDECRTAIEGVLKECKKSKNFEAIVDELVGLNQKIRHEGQFIGEDGVVYRHGDLTPQPHPNQNTFDQGPPRAVNPDTVDRVIAALPEIVGRLVHGKIKQDIILKRLKNCVIPRGQGASRSSGDE